MKFVTIIILIALLTLPITPFFTDNLTNKMISSSNKIKISSAFPPIDGNWLLSEETVIIEDKTYIINGSIIVDNYSTLIIKDSTIFMNESYDREHIILVDNHSNLMIINSKISSLDYTHTFYISITYNSIMKVNNSIISNLGGSSYSSTGLNIAGDNVIINNSKIMDSKGYVISLTSASEGFYIRNTTFYNIVGTAIYSSSATNVSIIECKFINIGADALYLSGSDYRILNNSFRNVDRAINILNIYDIAIVSNLINSSMKGNFIISFGNLIFNNNTFISSFKDEYGLRIWVNGIASVINNSLYGAQLFIGWMGESNLQNTVFTGNKLNDREIVLYSFNDSISISNSNVGEMIIAFSNNTEISNLDTDAIELFMSRNITIENVTISNIGTAIYLYRGENFTITGVDLSDARIAVYINNAWNILLNYSKIHDSDYGLFIYATNSSTIATLNAFYDNTYHIYDATKDSRYDMNFWDNYNGNDNNGDGIGDTPYEIAGTSATFYDMHPLIYPLWNDTDAPLIHNITSEKTFVNEFESMKVWANITDINGVSRAIISYFDGNKWVNITMQYNSTNKLWLGEIPGLPARVNGKYKIYARDGLGNWRTSDVTKYMIVDIYAPVINSVNRNIAIPKPDNEVTVFANVTDTGNLSTVILSYCVDNEWNNITMIFDNNINLWKASIPKQSDGTLVKYRVYANDSVNHWSSSDEYSYYVDGTGPSFELISIVPENPKENDTILIKVKVNDPSGVNKVILSYSYNGELNNITMIYNESTGFWNIKISGFKGNTSVTIRVYALDKADNWSVSEEYLVEIGEISSEIQEGENRESTFEGMIAFIVIIAILSAVFVFAVKFGMIDIKKIKKK